MQVQNHHPARFSDEVRFVPLWAGILATIAFVGVQFGFLVALGRDPNAPPPVVRALLGLLVGTMLACYFLLVGYVSRDAGRRGMSRVPWTLIAMFVPNALGIILYFVLRKPLPASCPQCGATVQAGFGFCPNCRYRLQPLCPHCQRGVRAGDIFCPYCGGALNQPAPSSSEQK